MYVAGTSTFAIDDGGDWATEHVWLPLKRYVPVEITSSDWGMALEHAITVVTEAKPWTTARDQLEGAGVGFDDGDMHIVWTR